MTNAKEYRGSTMTKRLKSTELDGGSLNYYPMIFIRSGMLNIAAAFRRLGSAIVQRIELSHAQCEVVINTTYVFESRTCFGKHHVCCVSSSAC